MTRMRRSCPFRQIVAALPLGRITRYSLKCQSSWRALASTATPIIERLARRNGERLRGKIAFGELPNGIDDRRLANPTLGNSLE